MDGSTAEHSDSDSGESWTILEPVDENVSLSAENSKLQHREFTSNTDKDEETDGISIISDSDPETAPCELSYDYTKYVEQNFPSEEHAPQYITLSPLNLNTNNVHGSIINNDGDLIGNSREKHRTYVHRRNKRLSTVLNIIMLGSVITAAGVAIGHMWGARCDCSFQRTPSVNKILSNLYQLQEQNSYLRNKLKEITFANIQVNPKTIVSEKRNKQLRCKKVYEGSINNKHVEKPTKCLDNNVNQILDSPLIQTEHDKEFKLDIDKLKHVYEQNKSWLDEEIATRMKREIQTKPMRYNLKDVNLNTVTEELIGTKYEKTIALVNATESMETNIELVQNHYQNRDVNKIEDTNKSSAESYSDHNKSKTDDENKISSKKFKELNAKKNKKIEGWDINPQVTFSENELKKDDRYIPPRAQKDRKKYDRQKLRKKQKRKNKYEQWEMKGGYLKNYDEFSISSSNDAEFILKNDFYEDYHDENGNKVIEDELSDNYSGKAFKDDKNERDIYKKSKEANWYDKRTTSRNEARKKVERELFGKTTPNAARWYFRRMQKREQCREKGDNSTHRKLTKRYMNYKMKR